MSTPETSESNEVIALGARSEQEAVLHANTKDALHNSDVVVASQGGVGNNLKATLEGPKLKEILANKKTASGERILNLGIGDKDLSEEEIDQLSRFRNQRREKGESTTVADLTPAQYTQLQKKSFFSNGAKGTFRGEKTREKLAGTDALAA
ncbi:MAG: hypothetical protein PHZ00_07460 [Candidatus Peribacteraceae bacterium]|nr:hypothetical protein [Candidatus Peribacteraceae bacterium]